MPRPRVGAWASAILLALASTAQADAPRLAPSSLPADGRQVASLIVPDAGYLTITARGPTSYRLRLIDRVSGPGEWVRPGADGAARLDALLEAGEYRVEIRAPDSGSDVGAPKVRLAARLAAEQQPDPVQLPHLRPITTTLEDGQQRSWWIRLPSSRSLTLQVAGRALRDLSFWRDGVWKLDLEPRFETLTPTPGQPLRAALVHASFEAGTYRVTAAAGAPLTWAVDEDSSPLHITWGIPQRPATLRSHHQVGPLGYDLFLTPAATSYYRLELPRPAAAAIKVQSASNPFQGWGRTGTILPTSLDPVVEVQQGGHGSGLELVRVTGAAGQPYVLQHFREGTEVREREAGRYRISLPQSVDPRDALDPTAILVRHPRDRRARGQKPEPPSIVAADVIEVDGEQAYSRRVTLTGESSVFLHTEEGGRFQFAADGVRVDAKVTPVLVAPRSRVPGTRFRSTPAIFNLGPGYHQLTLKPSRVGIVEFRLVRAGVRDTSPPRPPRKGQALFDTVELEGRRRYEVLLPRRAGVRTGLDVRPATLSLDTPLSSSLAASEGERLRLRSATSGFLQATGEDGRALSLSLDGGPAMPHPRLRPGTHDLYVTNDQDAPRAYTLERLAEDHDAPAPALDDPPRAPRHPTLVAGTPLVQTFDRGETRTYRLQVPKPGLYRLESRGLIDVTAVLRTPLRTKLAADDDSSSGRNFRIDQALRGGEVYLEVRTLGRSKGRTELHLSRQSPASQRTLTLGQRAHVTMAAGEAVEFFLDLDEAARCTFSVHAKGAPATLDVEDDQRWPMTPPGQQPRPLDLPAGTYRLRLPPAPDASTRSLKVTAQRDAPPPTGPGPHPLTLQPFDEVEEDGIYHTAPERTFARKPGQDPESPDLFDLEVPATIQAVLSVSRGMVATLRRGGAALDTIRGDRPLERTLQAGRYRLEVRPARRDNHVTYHLGVGSRELVPGQTVWARIPGEVPIAVGAPGLYELSSEGEEDVRATLRDAHGGLLAEDDDRPDGWNFLISTHLFTGRAALDIRGEEDTNGAWVTLRKVRVEPGPTLQMGAAPTLDLGDAAVRMPLALPDRPSVLTVTADADEALELAVVTPGGETLARARSRTPRLELLLGSDALADAALRVRSLGGATRTTVRVRATQDRPTKAAQLAAGVTADRDPLLLRGAPGMLRVDPVPAGLRAATRPGQALAPVAADGLVSIHRHLALAGVPEGTALKAQRLVLSEDAPVSLAVPPAGATLDLTPSPGRWTLVTAEAAGAPLGLASGADPATFAWQPVPGGAVATLAPGASPAALRLVQPAGATSALPARLTLRHLPSTPLSDDPAEGVVPPGESRAIACDPQGGPPWVTLSPGLYAVGEDLAGATQLVASTHGHHARLAAPCDRVVVLNPSDRPLAYAVSPTRAPAPALSPGRVHLEDAAAPGTTRLRAALMPLDLAVEVPAPGGALRVDLADQAARPRLLGSARHVVAFDPSGRRRDPGEWVGPGVWTLAVEHGPGLWGVELEPGGDTARAVPRAPTFIRRVTEDGATTLNGDAVVLKFPRDTPGALHLDAGAARLVRIQYPDAAPETRLTPGGARLDLYLPRGETRVRLEAVGGAPLTGTARCALRDLPTLTQGLGDPVMLAPGATRYFRFTTTRKAAIGVGVRAAPDRARATVLAPDGRTVSTGVAHMPTLDAGAWVLALHAPQDAGPVVARPALVGLEPPDDGPPDDTLKALLESISDEEESR